jgi:hypothetical protein
VQVAIENRWVGAGRLKALYGPQYLLATIIDPTTNFPKDLLPEGWDDECRGVLQRFHTGMDLVQAETELNQIVNREGGWGEDVARIQKAIEPPLMAGRSKVQHVVARQMNSLVFDPHAAWCAKYSNQFPKFHEPQRRLNVMSTQSADVERVCKVHKIIHTKSRNRLKNKTLSMLIFCYVNLRLIKKIKDDLDTEDDLEDLLEHAIDINADEEEDNDDEECLSLLESATA